MGYAYYVLPDGREAGYGVEAECDTADCIEKIDRGLGYLCGEHPAGHKAVDEPGCGKYFCEQHRYAHDCSAPECGAWDEDEDSSCVLLAGHDLPHRDYDGATFELARGSEEEG